MNSETAQILGTRLKQFQVVVSAADPEMATVGDTVTSGLEYAESRFGAASDGDGNSRTVFRWQQKSASRCRYRQTGHQHFGGCESEVDTCSPSTWSSAKPPDKKTSADNAAAFWKAVAAALKRDCVQQGFDSESQSDQIQILTLCEMQKETHADVALLQKRDFFADLPDGSGDIPD